MGEGQAGRQAVAHCNLLHLGAYLPAVPFFPVVHLHSLTGAFHM